MKELNLAKEICRALEDAERESKNNIYLLRPETIRRANTVERLLKENNYTIKFDVVTNSIEICVLGYVFDSCICDLKQVFQIVDLFVIDAMKEGRVSVEMKMLNAAEVLRRE